MTPPAAGALALPPLPAAELVTGRAGPVEYLVTGEGEPVTCFVHGLASSITQTRPFGSAVAGTRAFVHLRGHGATALPVDASGEPVPGGLDDLAADVAAVAGATGARQLLGVSLGASVVVRMLLRGGPWRRAVLVLPAALDAPRPGAAAEAADLASAVEARDVEALARLLRQRQPDAVRRLPAVGLWARRTAHELVGTPVAVALRAYGALVPAPDPGALAAVEVPVLVLAQEGDPVHPESVARRYADLMPRAELVVLPAGGVPWSARERVREVVSGFLGAAT